MAASKHSCFHTQTLLHMAVSTQLLVGCVLLVALFSLAHATPLQIQRQNAQFVSHLEHRDQIDRFPKGGAVRKYLQLAAGAPAPISPLGPSVNGSGVNVSAIFAFGDSTTDTGVNNYLNTTTKADYPPYGETYFRRPTGRYSDGRLVVDFLAQAFGFPLLAPFLEPGANFTHGANFASAGSGALNSTSTSNELVLNQQLQAFVQFVNGTPVVINGTKVTNASTPVSNSTIANAVFLISSGTNDYTQYVLELGGVLNEKPVAPDEYVQRVVTSIAAFLQGLYSAGARNFLIANVPAVGCAPEARLLTLNNSCLGPLNNLADTHNRLLNLTLQNLTATWQNVTVLLGDTNRLLADSVAQPSTNGNFTVADVACCGAGPNNATLRCGHNRTLFGIETIEAGACANPETHIFWDVEHGTEGFYRFTAQQFIFGSNYVQPRNLSATFAFPPGVQSRLA